MYIIKCAISPRKIAIAFFNLFWKLLVEYVPLNIGKTRNCGIVASILLGMF